MFNSGFVKSVTFGISSFTPTTNYVLKNFDMRDELPSPINQGDKGICVSVCATDMIRYIYKVTERNYRKHVDFFYNHRSNKNVDGMSPRNAFEIAQAHSLIMSYATIKNYVATRLAIISNGPVLIALPVYGIHSNFWKPTIEHSSVIGYHAVTLVGYDDEESFFILRNSWGTDWGTKGYTFLPYDDFNIALEVWTVFR